MEIVEGQVFEGTVTALGGEGPPMRWIVINPHGKMHAHSIADPLDLHCMPLGILQHCVTVGRLKLVGSQADHPVVRLQHAKVAHGLRDTHLGLQGDTLEKMLGLLESAVADRQDFAPFLAGEIFALTSKSQYSPAQMAAIRQRVERAVPTTADG